MRYTLARLEDYEREKAYRIYVTNSLQLIPQDKYLSKNFVDIIEPQHVDPREADDIITDIMDKAGLRFGDEI